MSGRTTPRALRPESQENWEIFDPNFQDPAFPLSSPLLDSLRTWSPNSSDAVHQAKSPEPTLEQSNLGPDLLGQYGSSSLIVPSQEPLVSPTDQANGTFHAISDCREDAFSFYLNNTSLDPASTPDCASASPWINFVGSAGIGTLGESLSDEVIEEPSVEALESLKNGDNNSVVHPQSTSSHLINRQEIKECATANLGGNPELMVGGSYYPNSSQFNNPKMEKHQVDRTSRNTVMTKVSRKISVVKKPLSKLSDRLDKFTLMTCKNWISCHPRKFPKATQIRAISQAGEGLVLLKDVRNWFETAIRSKHVENPAVEFLDHSTHSPIALSKSKSPINVSNAKPTSLKDKGNSLEKPYVCDIEGCHGQFKKKGDFKRHIQETHQEAKWQCPKCSSSVKRGYRLKNHIETKHPGLSKEEIEQIMEDSSRQTEPNLPTPRNTHKVRALENSRGSSVAQLHESERSTSSLQIPQDNFEVGRRGSTPQVSGDIDKLTADLVPGEIEPSGCNFNSEFCTESTAADNNFLGEPGSYCGGYGGGHDGSGGGYTSYYGGYSGRYDDGSSQGYGGGLSVGLGGGLSVGYGGGLSVGYDDGSGQGYGGGSGRGSDIAELISGLGGLNL